jgi:hypothetical protein
VAGEKHRETIAEQTLWETIAELQRNKYHLVI